MYNAAGLAPTIEIFNSTYSQVFYFKMKLQTEDNASTWDIDIPRENITYNTDVAPIEEWFVKFRMHHGLNMFTTEGTLLDVLREPILQWELGEKISPERLDTVIPHVINITLSESPCANDVVVIALICNAEAQGVYVGITYSGFAYDKTKWFNMTNSLCPEQEDVCDGLSLVNIILTNHHLIVLTTMGLFISEDLCRPTGKILKFSNVSFCGFEMVRNLAIQSVFSVHVYKSLYISEYLFESISTVGDKTAQTFIILTWRRFRVSTCFYSYEPFRKWESCLPGRFYGRKRSSKRAIAFLIDYEQNTGIGIYRVQKKSVVAVLKIRKHKLTKKTKFPVFEFPNTHFLPYGMFFHPQTHFLYVYGNEVWLSSDGGNSFQLLISLENEKIIKTKTCVYTHSVAFVSDKGSIFFSKAGKNGFRVTDVEKTVVIPGSSSFLITGVLNNQTATAEPTMPNKVPFNRSFTSKQWFMHDFGTVNGKKWELKLDTCRYSIQEYNHIAKNIIKYLDLDTIYNFTFRVTPQYTAYPMFQMRLINLVIGNPLLLEVTTREYWDEIDSYILEFSVYNKFYKQGKSSIAVIVPEASCICDTSAFIVTLKTGCLYGKSIHYISPVPVTAELWLQKAPRDENGFLLLKELPVNYRPPSVHGIAIPLSDNFYNADPSKPRMRNYFKSSKASGFYKKCANKSSRAECNCTLAEKMSSLAALSDCTEKVLRMRYPVTKLPIHFNLKHSSSIKNLSFPYFVTITEVNQRTNWEVKGINETSGILKIRFYLTKMLHTTVYNPDSLLLNLYGSELFHFKVSTVPGISHCNLSDEFQIYVDDVPLAFPGQYLISALTALLIGSIIFVAFLVQLYDINIWDEVKHKFGRFNKVSPSLTSNTATATSA
ncbi:cation channel sperm-associated auxiliary subunit beta [Struthio camelus]|uniref:cation channel sperm-associated auxiliary subunit beta n=1 Tax=Struthio camelus TaxID=8801 RepID=UPI003603CF3D